MKRFRRILRIISLVFFVLLTTNAKGQTADSIISNMDDVEVSLLTCGPGNEVYSLFGHTAIRVCQPSRGMDIVVNYGMFSFKQKYFIPRFVLGLTDYQMGITTFDNFKAEYEYEQRWVFEQTLNLTSKEKSALLQAIDRNYKPENVTYRYNFFYNNCTTKARDLIAANIVGKIKYNSATSDYPSFRELCHSKTFNNRWSQFGNDLLLGIQADLPTNISEQQFLPENLEHDFSLATIETNTDEANNAAIGANNASPRKLVSHEEYIIPKYVAASAAPDSLPSPRALAIVIAIIIIGVSLIEYFWSKNLWLTDAILMPAIGLAGMILFVMIFSKHPTVNINFQILILNPIALFMAIPMVMKQRKGMLTWWHKTYVLCLFLGILCGLFQDYAEGIRILALSLLVRYTIVIFCLKKHAIKQRPIKQ